ncbi:MAG: hypothetical protein ACK5IQ_09665 [Bacteroidales bacterium]
MKTIKIFICLLFVIAFLYPELSAQTVISSVVVDSATQEGIPYAAVGFAGDNKISTICSEAGEFKLNIGEKKTTDSITAVCVGYKSRTIAVKDIKDRIELAQSVKVLKNVVVLDKELSAEEIIEKAKASIDSIYEMGYSKQRTFVRQTSILKVTKLGYKIKKSTIPEINNAFMDTLCSYIPEKNILCQEALCDLYASLLKPAGSMKHDFLKSYAISPSGDVQNINLQFTDKMEKILKERIKRDSYFKIRSGIIGTTVGKEEGGMDSLISEAKAKELDEEANEEAKNTDFVESIKSGVLQSNRRLFIDKSGDLDFIVKNKKYDFEKVDFAVFGNELAYKISFTPKGGARLEGTVFINIDDYGIMRVEYENVKPMSKFNLFGMELNVFRYKGIMMFEKNQSAKYFLKYADHTEVAYMRIDRPLTIIEKNKHVVGRRKQNQVSFDFDLSGVGENKTEYIAFDNEAITKQDYGSKQESEFRGYEYMKKYDPSFWEGYNIIEPNKLMNEYKNIKE